MREAERRLAALEAALGAGQQVANHVVIYDPVTMQPLTPVPEGDSVLIWLPAKDRDTVQHERDSTAPG